MATGSPIVDTSLTGAGSYLGEVNPLLSASTVDVGNLDTSNMMMPVASQQDFNSAMGNSPMNFADWGNADNSASGSRAKALAYAKQFIGTPYVWGGTTPKGFDCSGFLQYTAAAAGLHLPRLSSQQAASGQRAAIGSLKPGDLVAFGSDAHHIAYYLGNGQILESPHTGASVRIRSLGKNENAWGIHIRYPGE